MICSIVLGFYPMMNELSLFVLLSLCVLMDVIDGFVARGLAQTSEFGRVFDMEVDAYFVMIMGMYFYFTTSLGLWLLLPGILRYGYRVMIWQLALDAFKESKKAYAAWLAGINFVLLLAAIIAPVNVQSVILWLSILIVSISFSISFYEVLRYAKAY
ncbi:CDP-alcohol phosphatidyltransferase family protein [Ningiella sp. W23]|uniref:CDP-alcohol phosphatidyltransferase family protein n=1 Tax=Ningiella sp. W23 TaxID=3023715 RepID=UPI0037575344